MFGYYFIKQIFCKFTEGCPLALTASTLCTLVHVCLYLWRCVCLLTGTFPKRWHSRSFQCSLLWHYFPPHTESLASKLFPSSASFCWWSHTHTSSQPCSLLTGILSYSWRRDSLVLSNVTNFWTQWLGVGLLHGRFTAEVRLGVRPGQGLIGLLGASLLITQLFCTVEFILDEKWITSFLTRSQKPLDYKWKCDYIVSLS